MEKLTLQEVINEMPVNLLPDSVIEKLIYGKYIFDDLTITIPGLNLISNLKHLMKGQYFSDSNFLLIRNTVIIDYFIKEIRWDFENQETVITMEFSNLKNKNGLKMEILSKSRNLIIYKL